MSGVKVMSYRTSPSSTVSGWPATTTVCTWFQLESLKVSLASLVSTAPSVVSLLSTSITTLVPVAGWLIRLTLKVAVPPASVGCPIGALML